MICDSYMKDIVEKHMKTLLRVAFSYVKDSHEAEDVVQDVFVKFVKMDKEFEDKEYEKAWLIRATINTSLDYVKAARKKNLPLEEGLNGQIVMESPVLAEIFELPAKYKAPVYLHYVEGYSIHEIGCILNKKDATVGTLLARGRKLLKESIMEG